MSEKWLSDDELNNILGQEPEEEKEENEVDSNLLAELMSGSTSSEEEEEESYIKEEVEIKPLVLETFSGERTTEQDEMIPGFETLYDVPLNIRVKLGDAEKSIEEILNLKIDSVIKLSKAAGELVELFVENQPIAKGEIVILDDKFGILINEILPPQERVKTLESKLKKQKQ